jgi:glycosyltransferase involved in cell wall biosynthesis
VPALAVTYANYIPERFIPATLPEFESSDRARAPRVVYEGSLNTDGGHYDLREIFQALAREGLEIHVYPSRDDPSYATLAKTSLGIVYHDHLPPEQLYRELPHYDAGWAGFNDALNVAHLETVLPNKLFEYIACGLPVVSFRHRALAAFIERHQVGLVVDEVRGLGTALNGPELASARAKARDQRLEFTVEANIGRVVRVYEQLAGLPENHLAPSEIRTA